MRFGPTSLRLTGALAKGLRRPKLRTDLRVSEQTIAGQSTYMIKIPESEVFVRFGSYEYGLLKLCDGTRTAAEVAATLAERDPDRAVDEAEVAEWLDAIDPSLWERSLGEKNLAVLEKIRAERKNRLDTSSLVYMRFAAWDPNRVLERIYPYLRWFYSRTFAVCSLALIVGTAIIVVSDYARVRQDTVAFYSFDNKTAYDLWVFWFLLFVVSGIHEFGHGLTCKHFGGDVHQMGLLLIYFTPAFFTDCSEMYMFDRSSKRLWTIFAGIWIELVTCGIATWVWYLSPPGSLIGDLGYKTLLLTGVSGVFFNLNPLMKYDGYYALCQYVEMDSLREESFDYLKLWVQRYLFFKKVDLPEVTPRKRRIYLSYGISAFLYSVLILLIITKFVKNVFTNKFGDAWGYLLTAGVLFLILRKRLLKWKPSMLAGLRTAKGKFMAWKVTRTQQLGGLAILLFLVAVPTATKTDTDFILEPVTRAEVRASAAGLVVQVPIHEAQQVAAGTVLAVLSNPELQVHAAVVARELDQAEHALLAARANNNMEEIGKQSREVQRLETDLAESRRKVEGLVLHSPIDGVVTTSQVEQKLGSYLEEGDEFAAVADRSSMKARVLVRDLDLEDVRPGALVKLKMRADPMATYSGLVQQIMPAAAEDQPVAVPTKLVRYGQELTNYFAVVLQIPNSNGNLQEGMTGTAKIYGRRYPIVWRATRNTWRWLRSLIW
jgi:putative peptide zinc metalloprotease protein